MKSYIAIILTCVTVLGTTFSQSIAADDAAVQKRKPIRVAAESAKRGIIRSWSFGEGTARAVRREFLTFEQSGKVVYIAKDSSQKPLKEGSWVRGPVEGERLGQLLARVDKRDHEETYISKEADLVQARQDVASAEAEREQARTDLELARVDFDRLSELHTSGAVSEQEFDRQKATYENAQAKLKNANARLRTAQAKIRGVAANLRKAKVGLERTGIFAPFDGIVTYLNIREGDFVQAESIDKSSEDTALRTAPIVVIDPSQYEVTMHMPVYEGVLVKEGQTALLAWGGEIITPDAIENTDAPVAEAVVWSVTPAVTPGGRTIKVKLRTTRGAQYLRDGLYVTGWIAVEEKADALIAPKNALVFRDNESFVFVMNKDNTVSKRQVELGIQGIDKFEIASGVTENDVIVTEGRHLLVNGSPVKRIVTNPHQTTEAGESND